ncbi:MAG TPA: hypothetical protein VIV12_01520 [Streptosporangiaceae bacterium]
MRCLLPPTAPEHVCDIRRRTVLVADPAAGADWSVRIPVAESWLVQGLTATLVTSAAVANRAPRLEVTDEGVIISRFQPGRAPAASQTVRWSLVTGGPSAANTNSTIGTWGGPTELLIHPGRTLQVITENIDVADQWLAIALDVIFELNRGAGAAKRYAAWVTSREAALPSDRLAAGDPYRG